MPSLIVERNPSTAARRFLSATFVSRTLVAALLATVVVPASAQPASAQQPATAGQPADADAAAVRAVVDQLFDGMRERDTAKMSAVFHADARLYGLGQDGGVRVSPASDFVASIAGAPAGLLLDEVLGEVEVRMDGALATAWMYYDFFAGDNFSHCGYNSFQLLKTSGDWKVVSITDSRRRDDCRQQRRPGSAQQ